MSWYSTAYRKLFFDFHSQETVRGLAAAFDAERWADQLAEANVQAVSVFTRCTFGWSYYRKGQVRYVHPQMPAGLDMVEDQINALHRRNIKAIGYYGVFNSEPASREYPEWVCRDRQGQPMGITLCIHSPACEKLLIPHIVEIVTLYDLDGMFFDGLFAKPGEFCVCEHCKKRFEKEAGAAFPQDDQDPNWSRYVRWNIQDYIAIRKRIVEVIHKHRPEVPVSFNWVATMRMPEELPNGADSLMIDIPPEDQLFEGSYQSRHWATAGMPFDIMNTAFLQWWGDWECKPAVSMQHEVSTILANGGLTWIGYNMTQGFEVFPAVMSELGKTLAFVKDREPLLVGVKPRAGAAILHSTDSYFTAASKPAIWVPEENMRGVHKVFLESGLPHHFVGEEWLFSHIQGLCTQERYPLIVLSNQRRISEKLVKALSRYVHDGGGLLVTDRTGTLDKDYQPLGDFALSDLLGLKFVGRLEESHCYFDVTDAALKSDTLDMPHLIEGQGVLTMPTAGDVQVLADLWTSYVRGDGKPLLRWSPPGTNTGHPAITYRRVGRGAVGYVAADIFQAYLVKNVWSIKHVLANLVRRLAPNFPVHLASPAWLEVAMSDQKTASGARQIVHLINHHGNRSVAGTCVCIESTMPVRDVMVTIRRPIRPERVTLEPEGILPTWHYDGQHVIVQVPEVKIHTAIVIE